jgi:hypothetical protein
MELQNALMDVLVVMCLCKPKEKVSSTFFKSDKQKHSIYCGTKMHGSPPQGNWNSDKCCTACCHAEQSEVVMWVVT